MKFQDLKANVFVIKTKNNHVKELVSFMPVVKLGGMLSRYFTLLYSLKEAHFPNPLMDREVAEKIQEIRTDSSFNIKLFLI